MQCAGIAVRILHTDTKTIAALQQMRAEQPGIATEQGEEK